LDKVLIFDPKIWETTRLPISKMGVQHGNLEKELSDELLDSKNSIFSHIN
jgi:hypothetical protein